MRWEKEEAKTWPRIGEEQCQIRQIRRSVFQARQDAASSGGWQVEEVEHGKWNRTRAKASQHQVRLR